MYREDFKIFDNYEKANNQKFVYLDNAASSLTPDMVVDKIVEFYQNYKSNLDRGVYKNAIKTKEEFEKSREDMADFVGAQKDEIVFTAGSTDSANKLAYMLESNIELSVDDEILTTVYEHHSSLLPLQELAKRKSLKLIYLDMKDFENIEEALKKKINNKTKIVNVTSVSNVTGKIFDIKNIVSIVKSIDKDIFVISDMTAAVGHIKINASDSHIDAGYFSLHKMFGPSGVGVLYMRRDILRTMKPIFWGGGMVFEVGRETSTYRSDVLVLEAGTNNLADVIASKESVKYINKIGLENIISHNKELLEYAYKNLKENFADKIKLYCEENFDKNIGIISFDIAGVHPHDVAEILARDGVALRSGHHCAKLLMDELGINATCRLSLHIYNDKKDIDILVESLYKVIKIFKI